MLMQHDFNENKKNDDNNDDDDDMNVNEIENNIKIIQFLKKFIIKNENELIEE